MKSRSVRGETELRGFMANEFAKEDVEGTITVNGARETNRKVELRRQIFH
jgi:hypothetical protein